MKRCTRLLHCAQWMAHLLSAALLGLASAVHAQQAWPERPVKIIVPFSAGSATDLISRQLAEALRKELGQTFVVENKPGASAAIGADAAARATPDGYTWLMGGPAALVTNQLLNKKLSYDPADFEAGAMVAITPNILLTRPELPFKNISQLIAHAKAEPGKLSYASFGAGTTSHLAGELLTQTAGIDILHVPYKGAGEAIPALISGHVSLYFDTIMTAMPQVRAGKLHALGISTARPSPQAPGVQPIADQGIADFDIAPWYGLVAPKGTSRQIIEKMNDSVARAFDNPEFRQRFESTGAEKYTMTTAEFSRFVQAQHARTQKLLQAAGIAAQ